MRSARSSPRRRKGREDRALPFHPRFSPVAPMDLAAAYAACAAVTKREAKNFYYAFLSLPKPQRSAVYALYAFCRGGGRLRRWLPHLRAWTERPRVWTRRPQAQMARHRRAWTPRLQTNASVPALPSCARGSRRPGPESPWSRVIWRLRTRFGGYGIDPDDLNDVLTGVEMDLDVRRVADFDGLRTYCYHVASAVGLATLPILNDGVPPTDAMREDAVDLGLGMQFVNILRDVREGPGQRPDLLAGRRDGTLRGGRGGAPRRARHRACTRTARIPR